MPLIGLCFIAHQHIFGYCIKMDTGIKITPIKFQFGFYLWEKLEFLIDCPFFHFILTVNPDE